MDWPSGYVCGLTTSAPCDMRCSKCEHAAVPRDEVNKEIRKRDDWIAILEAALGQAALRTLRR